MTKTAVSALHRVFPHAEVFHTPAVHDEIKTLILALFQRRIEE